MKKILYISMLAILTGCTTTPKPNASVKLEFRTGSQSPGPGLTEMTAVGSENPIYISDNVVLSNVDVKSARVVSGPIGPQVEITFTMKGAERFEAVTENNIRKPLGILIDGQLISAPIVMDKISGGKALIAGSFSQEEAKRIADGIIGR